MTNSDAIAPVFLHGVVRRDRREHMVTGFLVRVLTVGPTRISMVAKLKQQDAIRLHASTAHVEVKRIDIAQTVRELKDVAVHMADHAEVTDEQRANLARSIEAYEALLALPIER
jgi:hypothetical protein